jgi:DNA polymerase-3 subunit alpha
MQTRYGLLHAHSEYSNIKIIDSTNRFDRMVDYAWKLGLSSLAMTEHDCLSGTLYALDVYRDKLKKEWSNKYPEIEFPGYEAASKDLDFKVILGNEIYLSEEGLTEACMDGHHPAHFWHLILLAKDAEGYMQLKQLSSSAWKRAWFRGILRTPTYPSDLFKYVKGGHLVCSSACLGGYPAWCWKQIRDKVDDSTNYLEKLDNHLAAMTDLFGEGNYYIELQPNEENSEQNEYNQFMINRYWGKYPFIFTTDAHYMKADERELHKAFLNSKSSKDREVDEFYKYAYMMDSAEIRRLMSYVSDEQFAEMVNNTRRIGEMCKFYELEQKPKLATVEYEHWDEYEEDLQIFNDVDKETYPNFYEYLHTDNKHDNYLARLVAHGYVEKYDSSWDDDVYFSRLEEEFWTLREVGNKIEQPMADYFITMSKIIDICWNEADSLVGPSRGSAGALLINYLLGITQMNPVEMELPFVWRFLHPSRPDLPDIDFDTESDKRAKVFLAVKKYFESIGGDVINVCTFGTEGTKSALKTAGRGLKIDDDVINYITAMIPNERGFDWSLHDCYYGNGEDRKPIKAFVEQMEQYPRLWELASSIEGLITRLGVHASGVVCVNDDFNKYNSYMKTSKEQLVTAFDLHTLERCGLDNR